ncbi:MAG: hybrid sensor histidine kinase/response regulator [Hyphomicrobiales bacterium]|nr:MAG: hybrid sensor histidine kinase/response regulator [Hyphomicrobiales bacterium]
MVAGWVVVAAAFSYIIFLFLVATYGDRIARLRSNASGAGTAAGSASTGIGLASRPTLYALSLAVYCTSWTFFGSVGLAATSGWDFIGIYTGPILLFTVGFPLVRHVVTVSKAQRITSVADFISARYGKSQAVAVIATLIAVVGVVPYIALQLKAVSASLSTIVFQTDIAAASDGSIPVVGDLSLIVAISLAVFAMLFGTRHSDATEHQEGLMLAIAMESVVKLVAFVSLGIFVLYVLFDSPAAMLTAAAEKGGILDLYTSPVHWEQIAIFTVLSAFAALLLPRQFHVAVVENNDAKELRRATWLFPLYLIAINLFVVPIAIAGRTVLGEDVTGDLFVLALPLSAGAFDFAVVAFIGGLSAATAMVIVAAVALSIMISNQIVLPLLLHGTNGRFANRNMSRTVLVVRRIAIFMVLALGYLYYVVAGDSAALASIGLLSFAAIAQLAPAFLGGIFWRRATAPGAVAGMVAGIGVWVYTLLLPSLGHGVEAIEGLITNGPLGISWLRPQHLFGSDFPPLTNGVLWSLAFNVIAYIAVTYRRDPLPLERLQADHFVKSGMPHAGSLLTPRRIMRPISVGELQETISRYLGEERAQRAFDTYANEHDTNLTPAILADSALITHSEQILASAIGAASSRLVFSLLMQSGQAGGKVPDRLLDDASQAIQYNRDLLQSAIDHVQQGIAVYDRDLRLICWNQHFRSILDLPTEFGQIGVSLGDVVRYGVEHGHYGEGNVAAMVDARIDNLLDDTNTFEETLVTKEMVLEVRTNRMPDGGIVVTYTDVSERAASKKALEESNQELEQRVRKRTEELTGLNVQLEKASRTADEANLSKTRFLAAAGHDILQPLNAARLYTTALTERLESKEHLESATHVDNALSAVEDILSAILDISRLDAGAMKPEISIVSVDQLLEQLHSEFQPMAEGKQLTFHVVKSGLYVRSDRRLLRRLLQNLISNAIKYTPSGKVLVGCRRGGEHMTLHVYDTGLGVPVSKQREIFNEFQRLDSGIQAAPGLGLGLSIVERLSKVLEHPVELWSQPGKGTRFSVSLPVAQPIQMPEEVKQRIKPASIHLNDLLILCIDNEPQILNGMRILLEGWGCRVLTAEGQHDGTECIEEERRNSGRLPDAVLIDYHLHGGMRGVEVLTQLRWRFDRDLPGVLITADRSAAVRDEANENNMAVLNKPLKPAALRSLLQQMVRKDRIVENNPSAAE